MPEIGSDLAAALAALEAAARDVDAAQVPSVVIRLAGVLAVLGAQAPAPVNGASVAVEDHLLTVDEAAGRLGVTRDWLRRRPELPFVVKCSEGVVRYSSRGIEHWIAARLRRSAC